MSEIAPPADDGHVDDDILDADILHDPADIDVVDPPTPPVERDVAEGLRRVLLTLAVLRYLVPIAALPLVPRLIPDQIGFLTLLRPGKEIILLAGGTTRTDSTPGILITFLAYLPLMVGGVWVFYGVGRAYGDDLAAGNGPAWLQRAIPPERFELARRVLTTRGPAVAFIGRVAALPPTIVAAAAGTSDVDTTRFILADLAGAILSFGMIFGAGMALGEAYESGGPWLTGAGIVALLIGMSVVSAWLQREAERMHGSEG